MRWLAPMFITAALLAPGAAFAQAPKGDAPKGEARKAEPEAKRDPKGPPPGTPGADKRDEKLDAKDARKDGGKEDGDGAKGRRDGGGMPDDVKVKLAELRQKHAATRAQRRTQERERAKERWGGALVDPAVRAELATHARREARLDAMEQTAKASEKESLLAKIAELRAKEDARHQKKMVQLAQRPDGGSK